MIALGAASASAAPPVITDPYAGPAFQILAPGASGTLYPVATSFDQATLYNKLTQSKTGRVNPGMLAKDYLSEKFGCSEEPKHKIPCTEEKTTRAGLEIWRDSHNIPHIYGATRADVMFGSGWVAAEDRGLLLYLGLGPAYTAALDAPGLNPFGLLLEQRSFKPSTQAIERVREQKAVLVEQGPKGEQVLQDLESWVEGVNGYEASLPAKERLLKTVTVEDAIAGFAFFASIFGDGGGNEVANSELLAGLQTKLGPTEGMKTFRDFRSVNDPEAPTTTSKPFPYDGVPTGPTPGAVVVDRGSRSASVAHAAEALRASRRKASNFLLVGSALSASGHPLAVLGPQLGYYYPEIVMQADMHGGGIDAQGITAPVEPYVFIGRGIDYAFSLTSAGSENTQQFVSKLCNPEELLEGPATRASTHYVYNGECKAMTNFDAGLLGPKGAEPEHEVYFNETVYGPVTGTVTVKGAPYAVSFARTGRGREPVSEIAFSELDSNAVHNPSQFFETANWLETTFNMSYVDSSNIAFFSTGRLPILAPGTDPSLPTLGNGEYNWQGFLSQEQHPHEVAPASNVFLNWNNKPAPEWGAASDTYSYGPLQRVQMFTGIKSGMTEAKLATVMNEAATQDFPAIKDWPVIKQVLGKTCPLENCKLAEEAAGLVTAWVKTGAHRRGAEQPTNPGAAVMDAAWRPIAETVLKPVLGEELTNELASVASIDNPPNSHGSSYGAGWYGYVYKDLRSELGLPVTGPYSRQYCGSGSLEACRTSLWTAIKGAAEGLKESQGSTPSSWRAAKVKITFIPDTYLSAWMQWTNRSTFQQVIEFTGHE